MTTHPSKRGPVSSGFIDFIGRTLNPAGPQCAITFPAVEPIFTIPLCRRILRWIEYLGSSVGWLSRLDNCAAWHHHTSRCDHSNQSRLKRDVCSLRPLRPFDSRREKPTLSDRLPLSKKQWKRFLAGVMTIARGPPLPHAGQDARNWARSSVH
jgi:hypothetical protein